MREKECGCINSMSEYYKMIQALKKVNKFNVYLIH